MYVRAGKFSRLEHVLIVGTAGAVPHYTDYDRHVRLGDIVVSAPRSPGEPLYIHCQVSIPNYFLDFIIIISACCFSRLETV